MVNLGSNKKERGEDNSIQEVRGHLLYSTNISKSQGYARTLVQPVQNFGERIKIERSDKVLFEKAKWNLKIKMTSPCIPSAQSLD